MSDDDSDDDIDEDGDLGLDMEMDGYPSDDDDIVDESQRVGAQIDDAIDDDYRKIENQLAQKHSERRLIADEVADDIDESDDIIKESNDDDIRE